MLMVMCIPNLVCKYLDMRYTVVFFLSKITNFVRRKTLGHVVTFALG